MEMVDRYIYAVTQKLPPSQRKDIADELHGLIEDMLEERASKENEKESDIEEVIMELGSPRALADKYRGEKRYLIGPEIFDSYILVLKIVLIVISSLIGIGFIIQTILDPFSILDYFIQMIISLVTALPTVFGWTTFSFAIGEYFGGSKQIDVLEKEWKPSDLPPIPDAKRKIKRGESIAGIIFYAISFVFFAFSSDYFGVWVFQGGFTGVVPFLNEETYGSYLLIIILLFGFGILKECFKLISGKWTHKIVIFTSILNAISMVVILFMINGPNFWNPEFMSELVSAGVITVGSETFDTVTQIWEQGTFWILVFLIITLIWDALDGYVKVRKK